MLRKIKEFPNEKTLFARRSPSVVDEKHQYTWVSYSNAFGQIWCEGNFAHQKEQYNLRRTFKRGIEKIIEQCLLSACALNLKRLVKAMWVAIFCCQITKIYVICFLCLELHSKSGVCQPFLHSLSLKIRLSLKSVGIIKRCKHQ